jgi:DNA-binding MarR family transcriptional regulator
MSERIDSADDAVVEGVVPSDFAGTMMASSAFVDAIDIIKHNHADALGVAVPEMMAMSFILQAGSTTPKALATYLRMSTGAVTALLDRLEVIGALVRKPNPEDRRSTLLELTESGSKSISGDWEDFAARLATVAKSRSKEELDTITSFLLDFSEALRR